VPQDALVAQPATNRQHAILELARDARRLRRTVGPIPPVDPVQTLPLGPLDPAPHGVRRHLETTSDRAQSFPSSDGAHHRSTLLLTLVF
jgi:hypothetical protein